MKIAVTGASGFIGNHVLNELLGQQRKVVAITRDVRKLLNYSDKVQIVEMDISSPSKDSFVQMGCPDILIHLAWDGLPNYRSLHHFESELHSQYNFLKILIETGLRSLFVTGTCSEYGMQSGELSEDIPVFPANPYGFAKDCLHNQLRYLAYEFKFEMTWARLFYVYGKGQSSNSLYQQLLAAISHGDKSFDMSGGEQLRDYLQVNEVARLIVELALNHGNAGLLNVCSGQPISVRRLVEGWIDEGKWDIKLNLGRYPYPDYEPMAFWGDRKRLDAVMGKQ